jgi:hypothetical protein
VSPFKTVDQHATKLLSRIGSDSVSATFILLIDRAVAGSVSLLDHDDIDNVVPTCVRGSQVCWSIGNTAGTDTAVRWWNIAWAGLVPTSA